jgi:glycosyltransferase involved in cell wall biosynthesis
MTIAWDARLVGGTSTGDSTYWTSLLSGLARTIGDNDGVRFLLFSNAPRPKEIPEDSRFEWRVVPGAGRMWSLLRFPLAARQAKADIVHGQYNLSPLHRNTVTTVHDVSFFVGPEWFSPRDRFFLQRYVPKTVARASRVVTVSQTSKSEIERFIPAALGKVTVAYNAAPDWIQPVADPSKALSALGVKQPFVLTVGTRWPRKNFELALQAMDLLPSSFPHRLVVTGKGGTEGGLGQRGQSVGYVSNQNLSALYSAAELYLCPSRHEGFGVPVIEAMRCGCPVLASSGGSLPEVVGAAGAIETSWEPSDWAHRIAAMLENRPEMSLLKTQGLIRASEFSWDTSAKCHLSMYRELR